MKRLSLCILALLCGVRYADSSAQGCWSYYDTREIIQGLVTPPADPANPTRQLVLVVAHRGDWSEAPENSMQAIEAAMLRKIELIEIDVRLSQDGVPYLLHDYTLERTTTGSGYIDEKSSSYLSSLYLRDRYGNPTNIELPSLNSVLEAYYDSYTCKVPDPEVGEPGHVFGSVLIVDVKGGHGSTTYQNLIPTVNAAKYATWWHNLQRATFPGVVFKVKGKDLPADPAELELALRWDPVRTLGQNLIIVLNPDDPTITPKPANDSKFMAYVNKPYVLGFELNHSYKGDKLEPYIEYLKTHPAPAPLGGQGPRTIMMYLQDNFLPEGVSKSNGTCCYQAVTDPDTLQLGDVLDYRGRLELFGGVADLVTVDRLDDLLDYLETTSRRDMLFLY